MIRIAYGCEFQLFNRWLMVIIGPDGFGTQILVLMHRSLKPRTGVVFGFRYMFRKFMLLLKLFNFGYEPD